MPRVSRLKINPDFGGVVDLQLLREEGHRPNFGQGRATDSMPWWQGSGMLRVTGNGHSWKRRQNSQR